MNARTAAVVALVCLAGVSVTCTQSNEPAGTTPKAEPPKTPAPEATLDKEDVLIPVAHRPKDNGFCYVCHEDLQDELISVSHEKKEILCVDCHGASSLHMEDEMLMTKPDYLHGRDEVEPFCKGCHARHEDQDKVEEFREKWLGRDRPNGRVVSSASICTDCHGLHNIRTEGGGDEAGGEQAKWTPLFNGKDLAGWEPIGGAKWSVVNGELVGQQGENFAPGDLLTTKSYKDFRLTVTYRVEWPSNTGVWFRFQTPGKAYQADILEYKKPEAYSGTLYCPGKLFLAVNKDKKLVDREGWNTISVHCEGDHLQIWLNGHQVADVRDDSSDSGKIGFQVHLGDQFGKMKIVVREAMIQPLDAGK